MKYFLYCFKHYADFKGRARRSEFWWFTLFLSLIFMVIAFFWTVPVVKTIMEYPDFDETSFPPEVLASFLNPFAFIYIIIWAATIVPTLAVTVRRLHDIGRSGLWVLIYWGVSVILSIFNMIFEGSAFGSLFMILSLVIMIWFLVWMFTNSQYGPNEYGLNPKGEGNPTVEA